MVGYFKATVFLLTFGLASSYVIQKESIGITNVKTQHIYLFQNEQCTGLSQYFTNSTSVEDATVSSAFIAGMWQVRSCLKDTPDDCDITITVPMTACKKLTSQTAATIQVIRYGPEDASVPELTVFSEANFLGASQTIPAEGVATIAVTSGLSYVFSGPLNWALYSEPNFGGEVTCVVPTDDIISNGYGISYALNAKIPLSFKSAKAGACEGDGETSPTTPTPSENSAASQNFSFFICLIGLISGYFSKILH